MNSPSCRRSCSGFATLRRLAYARRTHIGVLAFTSLLLTCWAAAAGPPQAVTYRTMAFVPPMESAPAPRIAPTASSALATTKGSGSVMDAPLRLVAEASESYQSVRDYTCLFVKREKVKGQMQPENLIAMRTRAQPFSVDMRWLAPKAQVGQEVCYVAGRNNGKMRVHSPGILGSVGFVSIDPRDPRAMAASRHAITEAGIGNLIDRLRRSWEMERPLNLTKIHIAEFEFNKRKCTRVEAIHPDNRGGQFQTYRTVVYFDREHHMPIRIEAYEWPQSGGDPNGELAECYSYVDLHCNVGLNDEIYRR